MHDPGNVFVFAAVGKTPHTCGNARAIRITALMCSLVPIPYLFATGPFAVWLFNFYSGVSWGGFNIANFNYLIRMTEKEKSDHYIAFAAVTTAVSTFVFGLLGGFLSTRLPVIFGVAIAIAVRSVVTYADHRGLGFIQAF